MQLIEELERRLSGEESLFRAQLLREDIGRLGRLRELARGAPDTAAYRNAALRLGWTQGDTRTKELGAPLDALIEAVREYETGGGGGGVEARIVEAWIELHRVRMERLVGCLATPLPRPAGED
jgi:hypothetical protein